MSRRSVVQPAGPSSALADLVNDSRIILTCGPGGVGKTTTAAVIGLHAARVGRRVVVVTIDPARRLADALGLGSDGLTSDPQRVDLAGVEFARADSAMQDGSPAAAAAGELWAMMLDARATFDAVIARYAATPDQADEILANRFYRNISGVLSGTQEYMAAEKLYELHHDDRFDLVVIDTPPTRNALDFLDAPARLTRFLDHRVYRALMTPGRLGMRVVNAAAQLVLKPIARIVGAEVVTDVIGFFQAFDGMEAGFRERSVAVMGLLRDAETHYVLVASPRREAVAEAAYFAGKLVDGGLTTSAVIVNRLHPLFGAEPDEPAEPAEPGRAEPGPVGRARPIEGVDAAGPVDAGDFLDPLERNLAELRQVALRERAALAPLLACVGGVPVAEVPLLAGDVADLAGLAEIERHLFAARPAGR